MSLTFGSEVRGEIVLATSYFEAAVRNGSPFEAYYYLAEIQADQAANPNLPSEIISSSCSVAVSFYKIVAERGVWDENLLADAEREWMSGTDQGKEIAMLKWWIAAERGFEIAQNNLAYILDQGALFPLYCTFDRLCAVQTRACCALRDLRPQSHRMIQPDSPSHNGHVQPLSET